MSKYSNKPYTYMNYLDWYLILSYTHLTLSADTNMGSVIDISKFRQIF